MSVPGPSPAPRPRRLGPILAASACWLVGAHAAIVPGVVGFTLFVLGSEEGWGNVLGSGAGLILATMGLASLGSALAFVLAGFGYYRGRPNRAGGQVVIALGLAAVTAGLIFSR